MSWSVYMTEKREIVWHQGQMTATERQKLLGITHQPFVIWFTGLSGSGKSTLAFAIERRLISKGVLCTVLDGDNVRHGLNRDLGFSPLDRTENIRRVAEVARLMIDSGLIVITSFISPYHEDRVMAKAIIGEDKFVEVYLNASLEACEKRDTKGFYRKARAGELSGFTGISSPYEAPEYPELSIDTSTLTLDVCVGSLLQVVIKHSRLGDAATNRVI